SGYFAWRYSRSGVGWKVSSEIASPRRYLAFLIIPSAILYKLLLGMHISGYCLSPQPQSSALILVSGVWHLVSEECNALFIFYEVVPPFFGKAVDKFPYCE
ncbi:MAG: hypothetical protein VB106_19340, partial [Clostridiaceae bacterium]|nr:hypothetical protein [Clostridiaceae bacterium]